MQRDDIDIFEPGSAGDRYKRQMQGIYDASPAFDIEDIQAKGKELSALFPSEREPSIYDLATSLSKGLTEQAASGQPASIGYGLAAGFNAFNEAAQARQKRADDLKQKILQFAYTETEKKRQEQIAINKGALEYQQTFDIANLKDRKDFLEDPLPQSFAVLKSLEEMTDAERKAYLSNPANRATYEGARQTLMAPQPETLPDGRVVYISKYDISKMFPNVSKIGMETPKAGELPKTFTREDIKRNSAAIEAQAKLGGGEVTLDNGVKVIVSKSGDVKRIQ